MPFGDSSDFKELVRTRTDIVQLIGERVALQSRRGGREFVGLCPFHDDHDPSLRVDPDRQSYKCWACGEGGDCFTFVQKIENVGFLEGLELLATRANLEMPQRGREKSQDGKPTAKELFDVLAWAEGEYHSVLRTSVEAGAARDYLESRGFTKETVEKFRLGFSPADGQFLQRRARGRFEPAQLAAARLIAERHEGTGFYDYFRGRVMFPIRDASGRIVAFGGRVLPSAAAANSPKYINSAEGRLFAKNRVVYALDTARAAIIDRGSAVVMEGYADCIMAHQYGIANAVATLGTALTDNHVSVLKRFTRKVILVFDGDPAGKAAAEKSLPRFVAQDVDLRILTLTSQKDPADFLTSQGAEPFQSLIDAAPEAWEYKLGLCIERIGLNSIDAREQIIGEMLELFRQVPRFDGSAKENLVLNRLAFRVGLSEQELRTKVAKARRKPAVGASRAASGQSPANSQQENKIPPLPATGDAMLESELLEFLFADPTAVGTLRAEIAVEDFRNENYRQLLELCYGLSEQGVLPTYDNVIAATEDADLKRLVVTLDSSARAKDHKLRVDCAVGQSGGKPALLATVIERLKRRAEDRQLSIRRAAAQSGPSGTLDPAQKELLRRATEIRGEKAKTTN